MVLWCRTAVASRPARPVLLPIHLKKVVDPRQACVLDFRICMAWDRYRCWEEASPNLATVGSRFQGFYSRPFPGFLLEKQYFLSFCLAQGSSHRRLRHLFRLCTVVGSLCIHSRFWRGYVFRYCSVSRSYFLAVTADSLFVRV